MKTHTFIHYSSKFLVDSQIVRTFVGGKAK